MKTIYLSCFLFLITSITVAQHQKGTKERIKVYSKAIEGNLIGDPADRDVTVYLPPSYANNPGRRYPVVYMLHGFTDTDSQWFGWEEHWINLHEVIDAASRFSLAFEDDLEPLVHDPSLHCPNT